MRHAKILGLAVIAALALTALVGAGTASAKATVCSDSGTGEACGAAHGKHYTGNITATGTAELTTLFKNVHCESHITLNIPATAAGTLGTGTIPTLDFTNCKSGEEPCTASTTATAAKPWAATATTGVGTHGSLDVKNVTGSFTCGANTCNYGAAEVGTKGEITIAGGTQAKVTATVDLVRHAGSSFLCNSTATWHGAYTVTSPHTLYIT